MIDSKNLVGSEAHHRREHREQLLGQQGCIVWFTGLSGSGKSTVARALEARLVDAGRFAYVLDGDNVRRRLCGDLGFGDTDRKENMRRIGEVARLFAAAGVIAIPAFISPFRAERGEARKMAGDSPFIEVYVSTPLGVCEGRDPKGLYKKARSGQIQDFTGIDSPYEVPENPEIELDTGELTIEACVDKVYCYLLNRGAFIRAPEEGGSGI